MLIPVTVDEAEDVLTAHRSVVRLEEHRRQKAEYQRLREVEELGASLVQQLRYGAANHLVSATLVRLERKIEEGMG